MAAKKQITYPYIAKPEVGTFFTICAGLSFLLVCMLITLVGPSGTTRPWAKQNFIAFLAVLLITLGLSAVASWSKMIRRRIDGSPLPRASLGLLGLCVVILVLLLAGLFKI